MGCKFLWRGVVMTEREKLMYRIIGNISESNAPIIFKGGLITKLILMQIG